MVFENYSKPQGVRGICNSNLLDNNASMLCSDQTSTDVVGRGWVRRYYCIHFHDDCVKYYVGYGNEIATLYCLRRTDQISSCTFRQEY